MVSATETTVVRSTDQLRRLLEGLLGRLPVYQLEAGEDCRSLLLTRIYRVQQVYLGTDLQDERIRFYMEIAIREVIGLLKG